MKNYWFSKKGQKLLDRIKLDGLVKEAMAKKEVKNG